MVVIQRLRGMQDLLLGDALLAESRQQAGLPPMPGIWAKDLAGYYVALVEGDATGSVALAKVSG